MTKHQILKLMPNIKTLPKRYEAKRAQAEKLLAEAEQLEWAYFLLRNVTLYNGQPVTLEFNLNGDIHCYSPVEYNHYRAYATKRKGGYTVNLYRDETSDSGVAGPEAKSKKAALQIAQDWVTRGKLPRVS